MNWEAIGAIGEIMAAAGVIGSLVFVGWQMLQNTNALHTATSHSHMEIYTSLSYVNRRESRVGNTVVERIG